MELNDQSSLDPASDPSTSARIARTAAYYDRFADAVAGRIERRDFSRAFREFSARLSPGDRVLDIGCGTGAHMQHFKEQGYRALGIDPSGAMREIATAKGLRVIDGSFETLSRLDLPAIHGAWCAASLLHVPKEQLSIALGNILDRLPVGSPLFATVRLGEGASWDRHDDAGGEEARFIQLFEEGELEAALEAAQFTVTDSWTEDSTWGRPSRWVSVIALAR